MLVHKINKVYEGRSHNPNNNYLSDDNYYVVPDGSELAGRIISGYPYFDFVVEDGKLVDIIETEKPTVPSPEPSVTELLSEYVIDVDFRVAMLELGF